MPTTNPVPSQDPSDLLFNAGKLDEVVSGSNATYTDRFGISRRTMAGIDAAADLVLRGLGYAPPVTYAAGIALTLTTQTVEYDGEVYAPKVSVLPFTTSGTFETAKFRLIQGVASADLPALVGEDLQDYAALRAYTGRATRIYITGLLVTKKPAGISGVFQYDPTDATSADNGGTVIVDTDGRRWKRDFSGSISVEWFGSGAFAAPATNAAAITSSINLALSISPHPTVVFNEIADITGYTITINKPADYGDRQYLKMLGMGGGIKKTDAGFMFQGSTPLVGDISVMCMSFVSNNSAGTIVWDCNTIMRISSSHNEYLNVDGITKQDSTVLMQLMQSCRFTNEKIIGGRGVAFLWQRASDCTFSNLLVENRESCFENVPLAVYADPNTNQNFNIRITDCCIEGNVYGNAYVIRWGNTWACTIARNYVENNKNDIDLHTLVRSSHKGLTFMGNVFFLSAAQKASGYKPVKVGNLWSVTTGSYVSHTNLFAGNVSDGELYDFVGTGTMNTLGDYAIGFTGFNNPRISAMSGTNKATTSGGRTLTTAGISRQFSFTQTETNVLAGEIRTIAITLSDADIPGIVNEKTIYTVYPRQISSISVLGISPVFATSTSGTLYVKIKNETASTVASAVLAINVLIPEN